MINLENLGLSRIKQLAEDHNTFICEEYKRAIVSSAQRTFRVFDAFGDDEIDRLEYETDGVKTHVANDDLIECLFSTSSIKLDAQIDDENFNRDLQLRAVVVPGSFDYPGGGFLNGQSTEETMICHHSTLYPILLKLRDRVYVDRLRSKLQRNAGLYQDDIIVVPDVVFFDYNLESLSDTNPELYHMPRIERKETVDVIVGLQPDYDFYIRRAVKINNMSWDEIKGILQSTLGSRIDALLTAANGMGIVELIIGQFGCEFNSHGWILSNGIIDENGAKLEIRKLVAETFNRLIHDKYYDAFERIYFAIPDRDTRKIYEEVITP